MTQLGHNGGMDASPQLERRLPDSLDLLQGPTDGIVDLPQHVAWSGMASYDLGKPRQRMTLYRTVLQQGLHDDLLTYLNKEMLLQLWPVLRTLVGRTVRSEWENAFPRLAARGTSVLG
jgi:hypothetical protein